jgi:hypothetical protein
MLWWLNTGPFAKSSYNEFENCVLSRHDDECQFTEWFLLTLPRGSVINCYYLKLNITTERRSHEDGSCREENFRAQRSITNFGEEQYISLKLLSYGAGSCNDSALNSLLTGAVLAFQPFWLTVFCTPESWNNTLKQASMCFNFFTSRIQV